MNFMLSKRYIIHCIILYLIVIPPTKADWKKYFVIKSNSWRFTNVSRVEHTKNKENCLILCDKTAGCHTVNHNSETKRCELLNPGPWVPTEVTESWSNWLVYYKGERKVKAVNAWQTTTFLKHGMQSADRAIDGNRNNTFHYKCAHTYDFKSAWTMEFEHNAVVSHVIVYFSSFMKYNYRNTNLHLLVSGTRQDSDNDIGTECATYIGPPASPLPPVKITCTLPATGKFLKIKLPNHHLVLCEVEVFST